MDPDAPKPVTRRARLMNARGEVTLHLYVETRPCEVHAPQPTAWEHIFRCDVTGAERRWGLEKRLVFE